MMAKKQEKVKSCSNCQRYPLCRVSTAISSIISKEGIFKNSWIISQAVAEACEYYKEREMVG